MDAGESRAAGNQRLGVALLTTILADTSCSRTPFEGVPVPTGHRGRRLPIGGHRTFASLEWCRSVVNGGS